MRSNREKNSEYYKEYDRERDATSERKALKKRYIQTEAGRASHNASVRKWTETHPQRKAASVAVNNAIRDGRLAPWPVCAIPDCDRKPEAHHPDYDQPLDVVWLCREHHYAAHRLVMDEET